MCSSKARSLPTSSAWRPVGTLEALEFFEDADGFLAFMPAGSVELRQAIIELGAGLAQHEPDFVAYRQSGPRRRVRGSRAEGSA
jgi:hypothetical protein